MRGMESALQSGLPIPGESAANARFESGLTQEFRTLARKFGSRSKGPERESQTYPFFFLSSFRRKVAPAPKSHRGRKAIEPILVYPVPDKPIHRG